MDERFKIQEEIDQLKERQAFGETVPLYDAWISLLRPWQDVHSLEYARARYERGGILHRLGYYESAISDFLVCAEVLSYHFGLEDIRYAMTLESLAASYSEMNEPLLANATLTEALTIYENQLPQDDLRFIEALELKAKLLNRAGEHETAITLIAHTLESKLKANNCQSLKLKILLIIEAGRAYQALEKHYEAEQAYLKALMFAKNEKCEDRLEENKNLIYFQLANLYFNNGQLEHAADAIQKSIALTEMLYGEESSTYLEGVTLQSHIQSELGLNQSASILAREAIDLAFDFYGDIQAEELEAVPDLKDQLWYEEPDGKSLEK